MFEVKVMADLKHKFSSEAKPASVSRDSKNDEIQQTVEQWFERFSGQATANRVRRSLYA